MLLKGNKVLHAVQTHLNLFVLLPTVKPFIWSKSTSFTKQTTLSPLSMRIEQWKYSHLSPTKEYFTTLPVLCCSRPDLFEVCSWHKTWIVEKPTHTKNTKCAICHLCDVPKRKTKKQKHHIHKQLSLTRFIISARFVIWNQNEWMHREYCWRRKTINK